ncbi:MAG: BlaI/MecI/CopY family transcriptional regulator [Candidatus Latescibacterota bacterium]|nr:MAG: BlaI/MecI/CopY family transcriptional regulator [Candidatus Latescibacterota bacterium]
MKKNIFNDLSRREREIMNIIYELGEANVSDVCEKMEDKPGYNSVRITLGILAKKGYLTHRRENRKYIYVPTVPLKRASRSAAKNMLRTFFHNSPKQAIMAMIDISSTKMTREELDDIASYIEKERKKSEEQA